MTKPRIQWAIRAKTIRVVTGWLSGSAMIWKHAAVDAMTDDLAAPGIQARSLYQVRSTVTPDIHASIGKRHR
ncbi:hypothetical protein JCM24511_01218 [Saitozyma sp. JCM 24511]|nr:hypothetical protein JCM24511_01218 [Saitozyma sp. JCM 24511]